MTQIQTTFGELKKEEVKEAKEKVEVQRLVEFTEEYKKQEVAMGVIRVFEKGVLVDWEIFPEKDPDSSCHVILTRSGHYPGDDSKLKISEAQRVENAIKHFKEFFKGCRRENIKVNYHDREVSEVKIGTTYISNFGRKFTVVRIEGNKAFEKDGFDLELNTLIKWRIDTSFEQGNKPETHSEEGGRGTF